MLRSLMIGNLSSNNLITPVNSKLLEFLDWINYELKVLMVLLDFDKVCHASLLKKVVAYFFMELGQIFSDKPSIQRRGEMSLMGLSRQCPRL